MAFHVYVCVRVPASRHAYEAASVYILCSEMSLEGMGNNEEVSLCAWGSPYVQQSSTERKTKKQLRRVLYAC